MTGRLALCLTLAALVGCAANAPVKNEQGLAKLIGRQATVEGTLQTDAAQLVVKTPWGGTVPVEPKVAPVIPPGEYVYARGTVTRGNFTAGVFAPSQPDFRGVRPQHDLVLRDAKVERHAPPSTQPSMWGTK